VPQHESHSMMTKGKNRKAASGTWQLERLTIRAAENGGFIVERSRRREPAPRTGRDAPMPLSGDYESKDFAFRTRKELETFLRDELPA